MVRRTNDTLRIKRKYLVWLREAKGLSAASVDKAAAAVDLYTDWLPGGDLRLFHSEKALSFKRYLAARKTARGQPVSAATNNGILRELRGLFCWLADQPGLRSRIRHVDAAWFSPDRRSEQARHGELWKPHPSPEQMAHVIRSMPQRSVFERRDQALMAFLFLTGAREQTAMSVRLGHVDLSNRCVHFNGRLVDTKFGKRFSTAFFPVGKSFETILTEWMRELRETHLWGPTDPLFPKAAMGLGPTGGFMAVGLAREPWCSPARVVKIFKSAFETVGLPPFGPHSVRRTLVQLAQAHCRTPEQFKAWSQNLGHDDVLTTFISYGSVATGRQMELIGRMRESVAREANVGLIDDD